MLHRTTIEVRGNLAITTEPPAVLAILHTIVKQGHAVAWREDWFVCTRCKGDPHGIVLQAAERLAEENFLWADNTKMAS